MLRKIIHIDEDKCTGCGLCVDACHEGAIAMVDGKARLVRDDYCDGLGDCLPSCPTDAISFVEREAAPYDEAAVAAHLATRNNNGMSGSAPAAPHGGCPGSAARTLIAEVSKPASAPHGGCPGSRSRSLDGAPAPATRTAAPAADNADPLATIAAALPNRLAQWPCQIKLVPVQAPYYQGRGLLIAADCTAFACASFHERFMNGNVTIIGCPKLDEAPIPINSPPSSPPTTSPQSPSPAWKCPAAAVPSDAAAEALAPSRARTIPFEVVTRRRQRRRHQPGAATHLGHNRLRNDPDHLRDRFFFHRREAHHEGGTAPTRLAAREPITARGARRTPRIAARRPRAPRKSRHLSHLLRRPSLP